MNATVVGDLDADPHLDGYLNQFWVPCRNSTNADEAVRKWHAFLITSVVTPFVLAIPVLLWYIGMYIVRRPRRHAHDKELTIDNPHHEVRKDHSGSAWDSKLTFYISRLVSDQTGSGQFLKLLGFLCAMGSLIIYFHDTAGTCWDVEMCHRFVHNPPWEVDLAFNCYFLVYYIFRFIAAYDKLGFIFSPYQIADYFNVPPIFVAAGLNRNWYGLRFLRIINILWLVDLLHRYHGIKTVGQMQLAKLICYVTIAVICGAGGFLLLECSGDPWDIGGTLQQGGTFWNYAYFSVVTISTVGYGDLGCKTLLGRLYCSFYIFACLFFIASFIATAAGLVPTPRKYPQFDNVQYNNHVIICGHITHDTISRFLRAFYHDEVPHAMDTTFVIILHPVEPEGEMLLLLNDYQSSVEYVNASPMDDVGLERARARYAGACMVLGNNSASDVDLDETKQILLVAAMKAYCPSLRIQVEVAKPNTADFLRRHYDMDMDRGDVVMSLGDIQTGLLGTSGVVPGFTTLFCNLISLHVLGDEWKTYVPELYFRGAQMRLAAARFSQAFHGMTFPDAAMLCYDKLDVLLLAVYAKESDDVTEYEFHSLIPNPPASFTIDPGMFGQVIAPSERRAKLLEIFCTRCHGDLSSPDMITPCQCQKSLVFTDTNGLGSDRDKLKPGALKRQTSTGSLVDTLPPRHTLTDPFATSKPYIDSGDPQRVTTDSTGMFHWQPPRSFDEAVLSYHDVANMEFSDHIIILMMNSANASITETANILLPLRKRVIPFQELKEVIVVCANRERLHEDWTSMAMYPKVTPVVGDPIKPAVIRACGARYCEFVIVLSSANYENDAEHLLDKDALILTARLRSIEFQNTLYKAGTRVPKYISGREIPVLATLESEKSVRFLSLVPGGVDYRCTVPYMSGSVLVTSGLQDLMITAYHNPSLLRLFTSLVLGGDSRDLEQIISDGMGLMPAEPETQQEKEERSQSAVRRRSRQGRRLNTVLRTVDMVAGPFRPYVGRPYGELFGFALSSFGVLCLGLYRRSRFDPGLWGRDNRFVATCPPAATVLEESDWVYILYPASIV